MRFLGLFLTCMDGSRAKFELLLVLKLLGFFDFKFWRASCQIFSEILRILEKD
jgi:hypothetical protein